jgi:hypothetical protein
MEMVAIVEAVVAAVVVEDVEEWGVETIDLVMEEGEEEEGRMEVVVPVNRDHLPMEDRRHMEVVQVMLEGTRTEGVGGDVVSALQPFRLVLFPCFSFQNWIVPVL